MYSPRPRTMVPIHPEAWRFAVPLALLAGLFALLQWTWPMVIAFILLVAIFGFFRDPPRTIPGDPYDVVSPADGKVVDLEEIEHPEFPQGRARKIGIFLSVLNVHVNRAPLEGRVCRVHYTRGKFHNAQADRSALENENNLIVFTGGPAEIWVRQIAGLIARRIVCHVRQDDTVSRGQRIGLIRFGSRTELLLPMDAKILVQVGHGVRGGSTILARLPVRPIE